MKSAKTSSRITQQNRWTRSVINSRRPLSTSNVIPRWYQRFPLIVAAALKLRQEHFVIDGETVVLGPDGVSDFAALHSGRHNERAQLYAFDMLAGDGEDHRQLPLSLRKTNLAGLLRRRIPGIFIAEGEIGRDLFRVACNMGLEHALAGLEAFCDDRNGVNAKDLCPSPNQSLLDGFEFVDRVGFNRGGDAVFALYFLVHLPCPPSLTLNRNRVEMVWRADEGLGPSALRGSCGIHLRMSCRKLGLATLEEGRRRGSILVGPPKPAGIAGKPASSGDGVRHRGRIMAENSGASFRKVGAPVAGCSGRCSLAPPAV